MELTAPNGQSLYKDTKKQYDSFTWTTDQKGEYRFCFSNEFSTFTHKVVYFDFQVGEEKPIIEDDGHQTAMTQVGNRTSCAKLTRHNISSDLKVDIANSYNVP